MDYKNKCTEEPGGACCDSASDEQLNGMESSGIVSSVHREACSNQPLGMQSRGYSPLQSKAPATPTNTSTYAEACCSESLQYSIKSNEFTMPRATIQVDFALSTAALICFPQS